MWELDCKESWVLKNWCFWTVVSEKTLEITLDFKEIKPVNPEENQSWISTGRIDAEAEAPIHWPPDAKNWLIWKDPNVRNGEGNGTPLQYSCLENHMDRGLWLCLFKTPHWNGASWIWMPLVSQALQLPKKGKGKKQINNNNKIMVSVYTTSLQPLTSSTYKMD